MSISTARASRPSTPRIQRRRIGLEVGGGRLRFALPRGGKGRFKLGTLSLDASEGAGDVHALRSRLHRARIALRERLNRYFADKMTKKDRAR